MSNSIQHVLDFFGYHINCAQDADGNHYVPFKWMCETLGVDHNRERRAIKVSGICDCKLLSVKGSDGRRRKMLCLPLSQASQWLIMLNPKTVRSEIRDALLQYQEKCTMNLRHAQQYGVSFSLRDDAHEIEISVRELLEKIQRQRIPEHVDPRQKRHIVFQLELEMLSQFRVEPPEYREKAFECMHVAIDRYLDWITEYERNAPHITTY